MVAVGTVGDWALGKWLLGLNPYDLDVTLEQLAVPSYRWASAAWSMILFYPNLAITLKRCHDRNRGFRWLIPYIIWYLSFGILYGAGWILAQYETSALDLTILIYSGLVFIWIVIDFGILPGTKGSNLYGPDPRNKVC